MSKKTKRELQTKIISEMLHYCSPKHEPPLSMREAADKVSGKDDPNSPRGSPFALVTVGSSTICKWFKNLNVFA